MTGKELFDLYLEDKYYDQDKAAPTIDKQETAIKQIKEWMDTEGIENIEDIGQRDVKQLMEHLESAGVSEAVANNRQLQTLSAAIRHGHAAEEITLSSDHTPVEDARERWEFDSEIESHYPNIPHDEIAQLLRDNTDRRPLRPQERAIIVLSLKTGIRQGELINLDLQDVHLNYTPLKNHDHYADIDYHPEIENRPDTIYVTSGIEEGEPYRGEERQYGNKRKVSTKFPIDGETKHALVRWLAARPPTPNVPTDPLFVTSYEGRFRRISRYRVHKIITDATDHMGWNDLKPPEDKDFDEFDRLSHKWCRHRFSTKMRDPEKLGVLITTYFRGDKQPGSLTEDSLSIDPYTDRDWLDTRKRYLDNIYTFGLPTLPVS